MFFRFGGSGADAIKTGIDHVFIAVYKLDADTYHYKLISATADGASVNFGKYTGVLTQLGETRIWLLKVHCVNHRVELAVKDTFKEAGTFKKVDEFYQSMYKLHKNSGAILGEVKKSCEALDITYYRLPRLTGTRFVNHRRRALTKLIHLWPAILTAYENAVVVTKSSETKAKLQGFVKKLRNVESLFQVCGTLDLIEKTSFASLVFEGNTLMPFEVKPSIEQTCEDLEELEAACDEEEVEEPPIDSHLRFFDVELNEDTEEWSIHHQYPRAGHELRNHENREYVDISIDDVQCPSSTNAVFKYMEKSAAKLKDVLTTRFSSFDESVYDDMKFFDMKYWDHENRNYGVTEIKNLAAHFNVSLEKAGFSLDHALAEWKNFKRLVKRMYVGFTALSVWKQIFGYRKKEFPNLVILASIVMTVSGSNSAVERAFSLLTSILTDRRLRLSHKVLENVVLIKSNDINWSQSERNEIIERAIELYLQKRRKRKLDDDNESARNNRNDFLETQENAVYVESSDESSSDDLSSNGGTSSEESSSNGGTSSDESSSDGDTSSDESVTDEE